MSATFLPVLYMYVQMYILMYCPCNFSWYYGIGLFKYLCTGLFLYFPDYGSFLVYSRVVRIDSIHMFDELNRNAPFPSIQSKDFMRNAIGLSFDYERKKIFYSDIQQGSINSVYFNGSGHTPIVES